MGKIGPSNTVTRTFLIIAVVLAFLRLGANVLTMGVPQSSNEDMVEGTRQIIPGIETDIRLENVYFERVIPNYGDLGCFEVGKSTTFWITVKNSGNTAGNPVGNYTAKLKITDSNGEQALISEKTYSVPPSAGDGMNISFSWVPTYSTSYTINISLHMEGDEDPGNDFYQRDGLWAMKWSETCQDGVLNGWEGELSPKEWHITDSIQGDPVPTNHTSPKALYHGEDGVWDHYGINEKMAIISPTIDLTRFNDSDVNILMFSYFGHAASNDELSLYMKSQEESSFVKILTLSKLYQFPNSSSDWVMARSPSESGIPGVRIEDRYIGQMVQFMVEWDSDFILENETGFYLDDLAIVGREAPPFTYDVGLGKVHTSYASPVWDYGAVDADVDITTEVINFGIETATNMTLTVFVSDSTKRVQGINGPSEYRVDSLQSGESRSLDMWSFTPAVSGVYTISVQVNFNEDMFLPNNVRTSSIQVAKYLCDVEDDDRSSGWNAQEPWHRDWVRFDPDVNDHTAPNAWTFGTSNGTYPTNLNASIYSPVIDLIGVNHINNDRAVYALFKWYGETSPNDKLYFEYTTDGGQRWSLVDSTPGAQSILFGDHSTSWHVNETWGTLDLIGKKAQFRLRMTSDNLSDSGMSGLFIDDFIVLTLEERYGRPQLQTGVAMPEVIINDNTTSSVLTISVTDIENDLDKVTIDLSPLGGSKNHAMADDGVEPDGTTHDGTYSTRITASTDSPPGEYHLVVTSWDSQNKMGTGEIPITIWKNEAPWFVEVFPKSHDIKIQEMESLTLVAKAEDAYDNTSLTYTWSIDDVIQSVGPSTELVFNTTYLGNLSAGTYNISVMVQDRGHPPLHVNNSWSVRVLDVLPDLAIGSSDIYISDPSPSDGESVQIFIEISNLGMADVRDFKMDVWQDSEQPENKKIIVSNHFPVLEGNDTLSFSVNWVADTGAKWIAVWLDAEGLIPELNESNNIAFKNITVMSMPFIEDPTPDPDTETPDGEDADPIDTDDVIGWATVAAVVVVVAISLFSFVVIGTEYGLYRLLALGIPLYSRITGKKVLRHSLRDRIYNHIRTHPGDHYRSIMLHLKLKNGTLVHHLTRLEQEELIKSEKDGLYKRFYPADMKVPFSEVSQFYPDGTKTYNIGSHQLSEQQMEIYRVIKRNPGCSQKKIAMQLNESRRVINYHVKLLDAAGLIRVEKDGRISKCYVEIMPLDAAK